MGGGVEAGMREGAISVLLEPWAETVAPPHFSCGVRSPSQVPWGGAGREGIGSSFLAFGLKVRVLAKESELLGTISADVTSPVTLGKSIL